MHRARLQAQQADAFLLQNQPAIRPAQMQSLQIGRFVCIRTGRCQSLVPNVDKLLKPQYHLEIERRHSQLVITSKRVSVELR